MLDRYGVESGLQSAVIKEKVKATNRAKYGADWGLATKEIQDKITATCQERFDGNRPACSDEVRDKMGQTMIERYGVEFNAQRDEHAQYQFNRKEYTFPSGRKVLVQGYEDKAIDYMLNEGISETDIITGSAPIKDVIGEIWYDFNNEKHRYFPDFYLKDSDTIIEIKCPYTLISNKDMNIEKFKAAISNRNFKLILIDTDFTIQSFDGLDALTYINSL